jgi:hypothetical protein
MIGAHAPSRYEVVLYEKDDESEVSDESLIESPVSQA